MGYFVLFISVIIEICLGGVYAWSVFVTPLVDDYGLTTTQTQLIFGITFVIFTALTIWAGRLQDYYGPRVICPIGGLLLGLGYVIASYSGGNFLLLLLGYGVLGGAGIGFSYVSPLATAVKWFPHHKGLAAGVVVAGYGVGAVVLTKIATWLFGTGMDVMEVFRVVGLVYGGIVLVCSLLLFTPTKVHVQEVRRDYRLRDLVRQRPFQRLAVGMFCGTFAGMMVVGAIMPIGLSYGVSAAMATLAISAFAVGNAAGRVSWGHISDKIGHRVIPIALGFSAVTVLSLAFAGALDVAFVVVAMLVAFGFGSNFVIYAAEVATRYGADAVGSIYPFILFCYGVAGIVGPGIGGWLFDTTGSYTPSIIVAASVTAIGIGATWLLAKQEPVLPAEAVDPDWLEEAEYGEVNGP